MKKNKGLKVVRDGFEKKLIAERTYHPRDVVYVLDFSPSLVRTRHTIEVDYGFYLSGLVVALICVGMISGSIFILCLAPTAWLLKCFKPTFHVDDPLFKYCNHSFSPNVMIQRHEVICIKPIRRGDEITFNYHTTESDISEKFQDEETNIWIG